MRLLHAAGGSAVSAQSPELLTAREIEHVVRAAVSVGFRKFRLTGGEPTLRPDLLEIVERLAAVEASANWR